MSDEEAHRKNEAEKAKVETWGQTQKVTKKEMSDEEARHKKKAEKLQKQLAKAIEVAEGSDESEIRHRKLGCLTRRVRFQVKKLTSQHLRTCQGGVETWGQTQKVFEKEMSDEEACHKKEAEKATRGVETWSQTQKVIEKEMSDEEARHKKETEKAKRETRGVETWGQTQKVGEKEMSDEEARHKEEAEKAKEDRRKGRKENLKELKKRLAKAVEDAEGSDESEVSVEENDLTTPTSVSGKEKKREKKEAEKAKEDEERLETWSQTQKVKHQEGWSTDMYIAEAQQIWEQFIRGLNPTETQVHLIASRLSMRAVDLEEQTVEVIKAFTDTNRVLTKAYKPKEIKEEENVNIVEEVNGLLFPCSESDEHTIRSPLAGNDCFASSQCGACFILKSFAQLYNDTYGEINVPEVARRLWGDVCFKSKTGKFAKRPPHGPARRNFVEFILKLMYKLFAQVVGDVDKSLPMLCEQVGIRLTKDEMKLSIRSFLRTVCSRFLVDFNGFTSMCEKHIPSSVENAKQKVGQMYSGTSETERYEDMVRYNQDGRLMVHTTKQHPTENTTCFHVLGRVMSGTLHGGQEVRLLGKNYIVFEEEDNRNMRVGRLWVNEARYKVEVNRAPAGNWVMMEGTDQPIVKTSIITDMQGEEGLYIFRPLLHGGSDLFHRKVIDSLMKLFTVGSKEDTDFVYVGWHMKQSRHSITGSQDNYIKKVVFKNQYEPYVEKTCYMQNKESCVKKPLNICTEAIETNIKRGCFDISELVGDLVEAIHYEILEEIYQIQRCFTGKDKVCDTTFKSNPERGSTIWHARHEDYTRVREKNEQELEREVETVNQENDKQDEEEPLQKRDEITLPGIVEEELITKQERDDGVEIQEENGGVELQVLTRERVGGNSTGDAGASIAETNPADNAEKNPAEGVVVFIDAAEGIMLNTERVIKQAAQEKLAITVCINEVDRLVPELKLPPQDAYYKLRHIVEEMNGLLSLYFESEEHTILSPLARNVRSASSQYGACFTLKSFAQLYSDTYGEINGPEFARRLGGDTYLDSKTRKFAKKPPHGSAQKSPEEFILEPLYKLFAQVVGDVDKSLPMLCEQLGIRLTKDEMKLSIRSLSRIVYSRFMGDFNGFTSMCEEHIPSPVENAKQKVSEPSETERYEDMVGGDQDGRLMVHTTKQYPTENTTSFHVLGRVMSGTLHGGQEVRLLGKNYIVFEEEDNRNMRVGRPWVYEARYKVEVNRVPAGNWVMIEGTDQTIVKTSIITVMQGEEEPYVETTCYMQNKELCMKKPLNICTEVIETNIKRGCFDASEFVGDLVEAIHYETLEETYQIQRCVTGKDKVCDTAYKTDMTTKDDYQYTNVETPNCCTEEKVIKDAICTSAIELNCKRDKSIKNDGYGPKGVMQDRKPTQNCYNLPRKTQAEVCKTDVHRYCEKFSNIFPFPVKDQNCHFELKKICELEMKTRPKKAKKYSYIKDCKEQHREICDQGETKSIQPLCDTQVRLGYTYEPVETCNNVAALRRLVDMRIHSIVWRPVEVCKTDVHRYCEKFSNIFPFPVKKQNCHFEPKKICKLEMKTRLKKTKKYSYIKDCKEQPREICDQCEMKSIQPLCDTQERLIRTYEPVDTCNNAAVLRRLVDMRIHSFMWRPGRSQLADPLTKQGACRDKLRQAPADLESQRSSTTNGWNHCMNKFHEGCF